MVSTQVAVLGLAVGGSTVVVVPVEAVGVDVDGTGVAGAKIDGPTVAGAEVGGADVTEAVVEGADVAGAVVDGANVTGAKVDGSDVAGLPVGVAVPATIAPPPQPQHISSIVKVRVSKMLEQALGLAA